ncbi:FAD-dependent monooxygenase [Streptomyces coeruleoprunus]|uniref:FAD-dependent monooxygenase n=1 Tax=Streptomyces coeruleoprunus TaxID=285563 RepID=A0ABV9XL94_9ACTN
MRQVPVLVVGGSLTGLSAALFLGAHGVPCLVAERRDGVLAHPRLRGLLPRAMELYRQAGAETAILERCPPAAPVSDLVSVHARTLSERHEPLAPTEDEDEADPGSGGGAVSPCAFVPIGQDDLEAVLLDEACRRGADVRFGTELTGLEQDPEGVTARLRAPDGTVETVRAAYVIAADGAGSPVRRGLGIGRTGPGALFHMATVHLRADLSPALRGRPLGMAYLDSPAPGTTLGPLDSTGLHWFFATSVPPGDGTDHDPAAWVRAATGLPGLDVEVLEQIPGSGRRISTFPVGAWVADRFREGRMFLAGDAAHLMPPTGTFGGLTAVVDAHDLAWKLALVLRGDAGPALLDTYGAERRPAAERAMRQAYTRARRRWRLPGSVPDEPVLPTGVLMYGAAEPSGAPGTRAPHVYVSDGASSSSAVSTLDLYGAGLVMLVGPEGDAWSEAAAEAARRLSVPVEVYHLDEELAAPHGLARGGALLVRPDGVVAWRDDGGDGDGGADPGGTVEKVLRGLLCR